MPEGWTKGDPKRERAWERAKGRVSEQYPKAKGEKKWRLTMAIAKKMASARLAETSHEKGGAITSRIKEVLLGRRLPVLVERLERARRADPALVARLAAELEREKQRVVLARMGLVGSAAVAGRAMGPLRGEKSAADSETLGFLDSVFDKSSAALPGRLDRAEPGTFKSQAPSSRTFKTQAPEVPSEERGWRRVGPRAFQKKENDIGDFAEAIHRRNLLVAEDLVERAEAGGVPPPDPDVPYFPRETVKRLLPDRPIPQLTRYPQHTQTTRERETIERLYAPRPNSKTAGWKPKEKTADVSETVGFLDSVFAKSSVALPGRRDRPREAAMPSPPEPALIPSPRPLLEPMTRGRRVAPGPEWRPAEPPPRRPGIPEQIPTSKQMRKLELREALEELAEKHELGVKPPSGAGFMPTEEYREVEKFYAPKPRVIPKTAGILGSLLERIPAKVRMAGGAALEHAAGPASALGTTGLETGLHAPQIVHGLEAMSAGAKASLREKTRKILELMKAHGQPPVPRKIRPELVVPGVSERPSGYVRLPHGLGAKTADVPEGPNIEEVDPWGGWPEGEAKSWIVRGEGEEPDLIAFYLTTTENVPYRVIGPMLTVDQGVDLVRQRLEHFREFMGRESPELSLQRKYFGAHGEEFSDAVSEKLTEEEKDELYTMSPEAAHTGPVSDEYAHLQGEPREVVIDATGVVVDGEYGPTISDAHGRQWAPGPVRTEPVPHGWPEGEEPKTPYADGVPWSEKGAEARGFVDGILGKQASHLADLLKLFARKAKPAATVPPSLLPAQQISEAPAHLLREVEKRLYAPLKPQQQHLFKVSQHPSATLAKVRPELERAARQFDPKKVHIDRPKGTEKETPKGPLLYPTDYGEMKNLKAKGDGEGFDVFVLPGEKVTKDTKVLAGTHTAEGEPKLIVEKRWDSKKIDAIKGFMQQMYYAYKDKTYTPKIVDLRKATVTEKTSEARAFADCVA